MGFVRNYFLQRVSCLESKIIILKGDVLSFPLLLIVFFFFFSNFVCWILTLCLQGAANNKVNLRILLNKLKRLI